ncbi:hypothetical protein [Halobacillus kuroshimensis]|uniref:hypothetical protein n=1 Tax=Halobacillus kuroshimensis TaxID=302481 RepID=UPI00040289BC|nr:hypothetical protein [Halobacillus kuroshimensis]
MSISMILTLFGLFLVGSALICTGLGCYFTKRTDVTTGYLAVLLPSVVLVTLTVKWFILTAVPVSVSMFTWVMPIALALVFYPLFLSMSWVLLKRMDHA